MSYAAERWARAQVAGNARAKAVLIELAHCFNGRTGQCTPSVAYLSRITELKQDTITKATNDLQDKGLIVKTVVKTKSGRTCSYRLVGFVASEWDQPENEDTPKNGYTHKVGGTHTPENGVTGVPKNGGTHTPENGDRTGNKNREIEQGKVTRNVVPASVDLFTTDSQMVEKPKKTILKKPDGVSDEIWREWLDHKRRVSKTCTQRMVDALVREAEKAGITTEQAMTIQLEKGWRGFEAKYLETSRSISSRGFKEKRQEERHYEMW